jgi:hypothetical protein
VVGLRNGIGGKGRVGICRIKESVQEEKGLEWSILEMGERYEEAPEEFWEEEEWAEEEGQEFWEEEE